MKIPNIDPALLAKYLLPAFIVGAILVYLFIREIWLFFWRASHSTKVQKKVGELRNGPKKTQAAPVIVRKTDLLDQLNPEQKKVYARARQLEDIGQFVEAARLYEAVNFQRKAIDILENHGHIDQACAILLRMGVPYRAAVIYDRNGWHPQAAECFLKDAKPEQAGQAFEKAATKDFNYNRRAAESYLHAGLVDNALRCLSRLDASAEILGIALEHQRYEFLQQYLDLPFYAQELLPELRQDHIQSLMSGLPVTPQGATRLAHWVKSRPDESFIREALPRMVSNKVLTVAFWKHLDQHFTDYICGVLERTPQLVDKEVLNVHAEALRSLSREQLADRLLGKSGNSGSPPPMVIGL